MVKLVQIVELRRRDEFAEIRLHSNLKKFRYGYLEMSNFFSERGKEVPVLLSSRQSIQVAFSS